MALTRSDMILKCIVEYFIKTAQPLGSKTLIDEYHLSYSSATIRNEMYALEKMGYIEKTHLSGGRVPTSKGYKYYCEHLRNHNVDEELKYSLQKVLQNKTKSIEETIKASCEILSKMTSLVSVVLGPDEKEEKLASVQLIKLGGNTVTSVFVTDKGYVENKTFIIPDDINVEEVVSCVKIINDRLVGTSVCDLVEKMESIRPIISDYITGHDLIYQALLETFIKFASDRLSLYGRDEIFKHPEFINDANALKNVFKLLDDSSVFKSVSKETTNKDEDIILKIGEIKNNPDVSLVTTKIKLGDEENTIALVGPTRMDYEKAVNAIEYIKTELTKYFDEKKK
ncbi:MAG: heat-inducible transcriptional repressor HrcA [Bacilli bacterium]